MSPETLAAVSRPLMPREIYIKGENEGFQAVLDSLKK